MGFRYFVSLLAETAPSKRITTTTITKVEVLPDGRWIDTALPPVERKAKRDAMMAANKVVEKEKAIHPEPIPTPLIGAPGQARPYASPLALEQPMAWQSPSLPIAAFTGPVEEKVACFHSLFSSLC